ncbi:MAG: LSU ribosomal protein L18p (L5e), partial [uncultured Rubrobacteraceae bacterium]
ERRHPSRPAPQAPPPRPREGPRHGRAAAHRGLPLQPRDLRPAHRRRRRPHAGVRQLDRGRAALARPHGAGHPRGCAARRARQGRRRGDRRVRPRRLPVPRARQGPCRGRPRGRPEVL